MSNIDKLLYIDGLGEITQNLNVGGNLNVVNNINIGRTILSNGEIIGGSSSSISATNFKVGTGTVIDASRGISCTAFEVKNQGNVGLLADGQLGTLQMSGTLSVNTIDEKTSNAGITIGGNLNVNDNIILSGGEIIGGSSSSISATNFKVGTGTVIDASRGISCTAFEVKNQGNVGLLADGQLGTLQISGTLSVDTITEKTSNTGVTIENILLEDGALTGGGLLKMGSIQVDGGSGVKFDVNTTGDIDANSLTLTGDLTVNGTTTTVNTNTLKVTDSLIKLADGNVTNNVDIGIYGQYSSQSLHTGLFRERGPSNNMWRLFKGLVQEPTDTVITSGAVDGVATGYTTDSLVANLYNDFKRNLINYNLTGTITIGNSFDRVEIDSIDLQFKSTTSYPAEGADGVPHGLILYNTFSGGAQQPSGHYSGVWRPKNSIYLFSGADKNTEGWCISTESAAQTSGIGGGGQYLLFKSSTNNVLAAAGWVGVFNNWNQMNFTGQHRCVPNNINYYNNIDDYIGLIVYATGDYKTYNTNTDILHSDSNAITINDSLPIIELTNKKRDKAIFGIISDKEEENRHYSAGAFCTPISNENDDKRLYINSIGEGAIWIVNTNGNLENGDYIQSSNVIGMGEKQDDDLLHNYTVAKITCNCNFDINSTKYNCISFVDSTSGNTYLKAFVGCTYHCG